MTTSLLGLRTVIYPAPDLAASKSWWIDLLGLAHASGVVDHSKRSGSSLVIQSQSGWNEK
jgi:hypothetical protein